jgi:hypothetical protein
MEGYYYGQIQLIAKKRQEERINFQNSRCINRTTESKEYVDSSLVSSVSRSSLQSNSSANESTPLNKNYSTVYNDAFDTNALD